MNRKFIACARQPPAVEKTEMHRREKMFDARPPGNPPCADPIEGECRERSVDVPIEVHWRLQLPAQLAQPRRKGGISLEERLTKRVLERGRPRRRTVASVPVRQQRDCIAVTLVLRIGARQSQNVARELKIDRRKRVELHAIEVGGVVARSRSHQLRDTKGAVRRLELRRKAIRIIRAIRFIVGRNEDRVARGLAARQRRKRKRCKRFV